MLPDSQMDRFMLRLSIGYPEHDDAIEMIRRKQSGMSPEDVNQVVTREEMMLIRKEADSVFIKDSVIDYIVSLCELTRKDTRILQGASPRATLALTALAKATAWIQGRDYVLPRDIRFVFRECIEHRLIWAPELAQSADRFKVLDELYDSIPAPAIR
jgi:MoxR-like ATPase